MTEDDDDLEGQQPHMRLLEASRLVSQAAQMLRSIWLDDAEIGEALISGESDCSLILLLSTEERYSVQALMVDAEAFAQKFTFLAEHLERRWRDEQEVGNYSTEDES